MTDDRIARIQQALQGVDRSALTYESSDEPINIRLDDIAWLVTELKAARAVVECARSAITLLPNGTLRLNRGAARQTADALAAYDQRQQEPT